MYVGKVREREIARESEMAKEMRKTQISEGDIEINKIKKN
jgi:hypothetical protein